MHVNGITGHAIVLDPEPFAATDRASRKQRRTT